MDDWKQLIKTVAPMVGTALGGPFGGVAASFIADKLGLEGKTVEAVTSALSSGKLTGDDIAKIKLAEMDMQKFMADHEIKKDQLEVQNIQGARDMFVASGSSTPTVMSYMLVFGFFGVLGAMFVYPEIKESTPLMIMLGALGAEFSGVCKFWFGSNSGSSRTKELLAQATIK